MDIADIAEEILSIRKQIRIHCVNPQKHDSSDFEMVSFPQVWGSTALGFGGVGGQMITTSQTYVFFPLVDDEECQVYFGGRYAYSAPPESLEFLEDVRKHDVAAVYQSAKYRKT